MIRLALLPLLALSACAVPARQAGPPLQHTPPDGPPTAYDCSVERKSPNGTANIGWRLLPDGSVIEASGRWSSSYARDTPTLSVGWYGQGGPDPLGPESLTGIAPPLSMASPAFDHPTRIELRLPGIAPRMAGLAFTTPLERRGVGQAFAAWGEVFAFAKGAGAIEVRVVDKKGQTLAASTIAFSLFEEAHQAAVEAQAEMLALAAAFKERCQPYHDDPWSRDIIVT
jgi:hypothetical protein